MEIELTTFISNETGSKPFPACPNTKIRYSTVLDDFRAYVSHLTNRKPLVRTQYPIESRLSGDSFHQLFLIGEGKYLKRIYKEVQK